MDTLIIKGRKHVILGAWGCGEFHNSPNVVARIYQEEISKRAEHFEHIVFAILRTASHHHINHVAFEKHLAGLKLGSKAHTTQIQVPTKLPPRLINRNQILKHHIFLKLIFLF